MTFRTSSAFTPAHVLLLVSFVCYPWDQLVAWQNQGDEAEQVLADWLNDADIELRTERLRGVIADDADNELAHWHLGEIRSDGQWITTAEYQQLMANDPTLAEYRSLREKVFLGHMTELSLAGWCRRQSWLDAERLHLHRVVRSDNAPPTDRREAANRVGLRVFQGMLLSGAEIKRVEQQVESEQRSSKKWTPTVEKWQTAISGPQASKRRYALEQLRAVREKNAIPTLERLLSVRSEALANEAVGVLANISAFEATESLVRHSLFLPWDGVRDAAVEQLKKRALHDYAPLLLGELTAPLESRSHVSIGPDGLVRRRHQLHQAGPVANQVVNTSATRAPRAARRVRVVYFPTGQPVRIQGYASALNEATWKALSDLRSEPEDKAARAKLNRLLSQQWALEFERRLITMQEAQRAAQVEQNIALTNRHIAEKNNRVLEVLHEVVDADVEQTPSAWWEWWQEYNETYREEKPTYVHNVGYSDPCLVSMEIRYTSCFPAGTKVRTSTGLVAIEKVLPGDRVLSQDVDTGELHYALVTATTERPPSNLLRITLDDDVILATKGHPVWVNNVGWRMAKRLKVGDQLHTFDGSRTITDIVDGGEARAYNLVVENSSTYFVGMSGVLAHDNTYRKPTLALTPGVLGPAADVALR